MFQYQPQIQIFLSFAFYERLLLVIYYFYNSSLIKSTSKAAVNVTEDPVPTGL
jgi:hypothetical protein